MRKMIFLSWIILLFASVTWGQEKVDAPVWNVGDKWIFTYNGIIEVLSIDQDGYVVKFSDDIAVTERQGFDKVIFDKATMQRIYSLSAGSFFLKGEKRNKYSAGLRNILNFPFTPGKQWENAYSAKPVISTLRHLPSLDYYEKFKILGWEEVGVQAGKFRALKIQCIRGHQAMPQAYIYAAEGKSFYWYSPDVGYFVKCEPDKAWVEQSKEIFNWELLSFQLKK